VDSERAIRGRRAVREALALPETPETLERLLSEAEVLRTERWGRKVRLHRLANVKAGTCTEDCGFCAQSVRFDAPIARWNFLSREEMIAEADRAEAIGAAKVCYVAAIRGPSDGDVARISEVVREVKAPLLMNQVPGGRTPMVKTAELERMGFKIVIHPAVCMEAAIPAMETALQRLKDTGTDFHDGRTLSPMDIFKKVGFDWWHEVEERFRA